MHGVRSLIALFAVLIGLGAYIYFVTWEMEDDTGVEDVFASLTAEDIEALSVKSESGDRTALKKEGEDWQVVSPVAVRASSSDVSSLTNALDRLEIVRVIDENPADLAEYGLESPRIEIELSVADGGPSGTLLVGDTTPTGDNLYAKKRDEPRVFLIPEFQDSSINKSTFDLRDKRLLRFDSDTLSSVELHLGNRTFEIQKEGSAWRVTKPVSVRTDYSAVQNIVGRLQTESLRSVVAEEAAEADLRSYGLDRPDISVVFNMGTERTSLEIGAEAGDDRRYARDTSKPAIVTIDNALAQALRKELDDFRSRDVFDFLPLNVTRAEFTRNDQTVVFQQVGEAEDQSAWRRVTPNPAEVDAAAMEGMLASLSATRSTSFTPSTANTGPEFAGSYCSGHLRRGHQGRARHVRAAGHRCVRLEARRSWGGADRPGEARRSPPCH